MTAPVGERWVEVPGWGRGYVYELSSGRVRSVDRWQVNARGVCRYLKGVELKPCGVGGTVVLAHQGCRRSFTAASLRRVMEGRPS